jgi:hypothetical protein
MVRVWMMMEMALDGQYGDGGAIRSLVRFWSCRRGEDGELRLRISD